MCSLSSQAPDSASATSSSTLKIKEDKLEDEGDKDPESPAASSGKKKKDKDKDKGKKDRSSASKSKTPDEEESKTPDDKAKAGAFASEGSEAKVADKSFLSKVKLFKKLPKDSQSVLQQICVPEDFPEGHTLIKQGDTGNEFYVVVSGKVKVNVDDKDVATLGVGDYFGEVALLRDEPRTATIIAATKISVLKITREAFKESGLINKLEFQKRAAVGGGADAPLVTKPPSAKTDGDKEVMKKALKGNKNLSEWIDMDDSKCNAMIDVAWEETVASGKDVITQGSEQADYFYVVKEGSLDIFVAKPPEEGQSAEEAKAAAVKVLTVNPGMSFGELALIYFAPRAATVTATEASTMWVIDRANFKKILASKAEDTAKSLLKHLDKVDMFKELKADEKMEVAKGMTEGKFSKGEHIYDQGEEAKSFHLLVDGEVSLSKDGKDTKVKGTKDKAGIFGEQALLEEGKRAETVVVTSDSVTTFSMDRTSFELLLGPLADIKKRGSSGESKVGKGGKAKMKAKAKAKAKGGGDEPEEKKILRKELRKLGLLGCGGFGAVDLVEHTTTKNTYALKSLSKGHVVKCRMQESVMSEKTIQCMCTSTFVVRLYECYNEPQNLCFLLELALGGELYDTYCKKGFHGSLKHAQFYVAGTTYAFEHMHDLKIVYRDLKPENLLLVEGGNVKITDMGLAKVVVGKTNTTCGTPDYFAPEVIASSGHNHSVDWYTLGILLFELMIGNPPFESANPQQTMGKIQKGIATVKFPAKLKGDGEDIVKKLCHKTAAERIPMKKGGIENIQKHPWYKDFDWDAMKAGTLDQPYKPAVKGKTDLKNFSANAADKPPQIPYKDDGSGWDKDFATSS